MHHYVTTEKKKKKETQKFNNLPMCLAMVLKVVAYQASLGPMLKLLVSTAGVVELHLGSSP